MVINNKSLLLKLCEIFFTTIDSEKIHEPKADRSFTRIALREPTITVPDISTPERRFLVSCACGGR